ncbi:Tapt1 family, partial [Sesbania bispinosa]
NVILVYLCEMAIDIIKHSFIAKFNNISPIAYSEFLEDLCRQTLHMQTEDAKKNLTFVPLAPACVVIRVLTPVYAANIPYNPLPWRLFWILLFSAITYILLTSLKGATKLMSTAVKGIPLLVLEEHKCKELVAGARWVVPPLQSSK